MKKWDFAQKLGLILVISNAVGIVVLLEMIFLRFPYITLFAVIFFITYEANKKLFTRRNTYRVRSS